MRRRKILDVDQRLSLFPFFFLLQLLFLRNRLLQIRHIHNLDSRHIHKLAVINISIIHSVKALLHTVAAHRNMVGQINHLPCHTLRTSANKTYFFVLVILLIFGRLYADSFNLFYFLVLVIWIFIFLIRHTIPSFSLFLLSIFLCHIYKILFRNNRYLKFIRLLIF